MEKSLHILSNRFLTTQKYHSCQMLYGYSYLNAKILGGWVGKDYLIYVENRSFISIHDTFLFQFTILFEKFTLVSHEDT